MRILGRIYVTGEMYVYETNDHDNDNEVVTVITGGKPPGGTRITASAEVFCNNNDQGVSDIQQIIDVMINKIVHP